MSDFKEVVDSFDGLTDAERALNVAMEYQDTLVRSIASKYEYPDVSFDDGIEAEKFGDEYERLTIKLINLIQVAKLKSKIEEIKKAISNTGSVSIEQQISMDYFSWVISEIEQDKVVEKGTDGSRYTDNNNNNGNNNPAISTDYVDENVYDDDVVDSDDIFAEPTEDSGKKLK